MRSESPLPGDLFIGLDVFATRDLLKPWLASVELQCPHDDHEHHNRTEKNSGQVKHVNLLILVSHRDSVTRPIHGQAKESHGFL